MFPSGATALWARFYREEQIASEYVYEKICFLRTHHSGADRSLRCKAHCAIADFVFPSDEAPGSTLASLANSGLNAVGQTTSTACRSENAWFRVHGGFALNAANTEALRFYREQGLSSITFL
jgi:hypothetical protein